MLKSLIVAHRGFTPEAEIRAKDNDIELLTLVEAKHANWSQVVPQAFTLHYDVWPETVDFHPSIGDAEDNKAALKEGTFNLQMPWPREGHPVWLGINGLGTAPQC
jgi:hypothetical protein